MDDLQAAVAEAIREACADQTDCAAHDNRCDEIHSVHITLSSNRTIVSVEADVDAIAAIAVRVLRQRCCRP